MVEQFLEAVLNNGFSPRTPRLDSAIGVKNPLTGRQWKWGMGENKRGVWRSLSMRRSKFGPDTLSAKSIAVDDGF